MKPSIPFVTLIAIAAAAPAPLPELVTVWQFATQVLNQDGSVYTTIPAAAAAAPAASPAVQAPPVQASPAAQVAPPVQAAPAANPIANPAASSSFASSAANLIISFIQNLFGSSGSNGGAFPAPSPVPTTTSIVVQQAPAKSSPAPIVYLVPTSSAEAALFSSQSTAPAVPEASPSSSSSSSSSSLSSSNSAGITGSSKLDFTWAKSILDAHNEKRAIHSSPPLTWDSAVYTYAQNYADKYDCSGVLTHSGGQYGENLAAGFSTGVDALDAWYEEGTSYDYSAGNSYDHFTQVVWKSSTKVGCAYKDCRAQNWGYYIICSYNPPGNVVGQNSANVLSPN